MNIYHESQPLDLKQANVVNDSESTMEMAANAGLQISLDSSGISLAEGPY
jgi:hypothetical protein